MQKLTSPKQVERWGLFECSLEGPAEGNPYLEQTVSARFAGRGGAVTVDGFYDGNGVYRVRFMPSCTGSFSFEVTASFLQAPLKERFEVTPAREGNHGPVRVANTYHFAYEDGTPYRPLGTTCYVWQLQSEVLQKQTLEELAQSGFNKIRFCVFPKHYDYNLQDPPCFPYEGTPMDSSVLTSENFHQYTGSAPGNHWDFTRFNPAYFQHLDGSIAALCDLSIEADLIMLHPYDRWGFSRMTPEQDALYVRYLVARYAAYRNLWWSLANEYDLMPQKSIADWERIADILCAQDPYAHLRSIHNCIPFYDYRRPWITHCSMQRQELYLSGEKTAEWRAQYRKPVVIDELCYEGNVQHGWGNITGQELVRRFWEAACRGGYCSHGETFLGHGGVLWWSHGGKLHGESPARLAFLRQVLDDAPAGGLMPWTGGGWDQVAATEDTFLGGGAYYLFYFSFMRPSFREFDFGDEGTYHVDVIDTWEMTIEDHGCHSGKFRVELPGKEYMAVRLRRAETNAQ